MQTRISCAEQDLSLIQPQVMGILNVTPDSFSDGGRFQHLDAALHQTERMILEGAAIIDIGGESTRPGAKDVSEQEELARVIPLLKAIKSRFNIIVSIDTSKANVMAEAIAHGAGLINDVRALQNTNCLTVMAQSHVPICLMHMQGLPRTMQKKPHYNDLMTDIVDFFQQRIKVCQQAGINKQRLILDPGFGFGKTVTQNYQLLAQLADFNQLDLPILIGVSRKAMIGDVLNCDVEQRLAGSLSAAIIAMQQGAKIIRVHDVKQTTDAIKVINAVNTACS